MFRGLIFQTRERDALNDLFLEDEEGYQYRNRADDTRGEGEGVLGVVGGLEEGDANGEGVLIYGVEEDKGAEKLVPRADEGKHTQRGESRARER